jgi:type IV pilus assembly protein PilA
MFARIRKAQENEGGFTLIELLVVMIIIGILAAIAIPAFLSQKKKGYEASMKSDLRSLATEASTQMVDQPSSIPVSFTGTTVTIGSGSISLSPGNALVGGGTDSIVKSVDNGTYCFQISHSGAADWVVYKNNPTDSQTLKAGSCSAGVGS